MKLTGVRTKPKGRIEDPIKYLVFLSHGREGVLGKRQRGRGFCNWVQGRLRLIEVSEIKRLRLEIQKLKKLALKKKRQKNIVAEKINQTN
jgi:hypothetical protein